MAKMNPLWTKCKTTKYIRKLTLTHFCFDRMGGASNPKLLGIVAMQKRDDQTAELNRLAVRPDMRCLGVGRKLVTAVIQVSRTVQPTLNLIKLFSVGNLNIRISPDI